MNSTTPLVRCTWNPPIQLQRGCAVFGKLVARTAAALLLPEGGPCSTPL
jgi:hypothetical protein